MKKENDIIAAWKLVYQEKKYWMITIVAALLLFSLNAVMRNYQLLISQFSLELLFSIIIGLKTTFTMFGFFALIAISLLGGVVMAYSIFVRRRQLSLSAGVGAPSMIAASSSAGLSQLCRGPVWHLRDRRIPYLSPLERAGI